MATALTPSVRDLVERGQRDAEAKSLDELAATITASFEQTDLTNLNLAALPGTLGAAEDNTSKLIALQDYVRGLLAIDFTGAQPAAGAQ